MISCGAEVIARHRRSYERERPHPLWRSGAQDWSAGPGCSFGGWELPEEFGVLRRLLESRIRRGKREFAGAAVDGELPNAGGVRGRRDQARGHKPTPSSTWCCAEMEGRLSETRLQLYPYLPRVTVTKTAAGLHAHAGEARGHGAVGASPQGAEAADLPEGVRQGGWSVPPRTSTIRATCRLSELELIDRPSHGGPRSRLLASLPSRASTPSTSWPCRR